MTEGNRNTVIQISNEQPCECFACDVLLEDILDRAEPIYTTGDESELTELTDTDAEPDSASASALIRLQDAIHGSSDPSSLTSNLSSSSGDELDSEPGPMNDPDARCMQFEEHALASVGLSLAPTQLDEEDTDEDGYAGDQDINDESGESITSRRPRKRRKRKIAPLPPVDHAHTLHIPPPTPLEPPIVTQPPPSGSSTAYGPTHRRKARDRARSKLHKKKARKPIAEAREGRLPQPAKVVVNLNAEKLKTRAAHGAYVGRGGDGGIVKIPTLAEVEAMGHQHIKWNGRCPLAILDRQGRILAMCAGQPTPAPTEMPWPTKEFSRLMRLARKYAYIPMQKRVHRRGKYATLHSGISYGGGQKCPTNLRPTSVRNQLLISMLLGSTAVKQFAGFADQQLLRWAPSIYSRCKHVRDTLLTTHQDLRGNFSNSILPSATFNAGPRTVCRLHVDCRNKPDCWCLIQALGTFDSTRGGHLWLPDLAIFIEFPPGSLIMIPSALLRHGNLSLASETERRYSFTQYIAGALFRWIRFGYKSRKQTEEDGDHDLLAEVEQEARVAWSKIVEEWPLLSQVPLQQ